MNEWLSPSSPPIQYWIFIVHNLTLEFHINEMNFIWIIPYTASVIFVPWLYVFLAHWYDLNWFVSMWDKLNGNMFTIYFHKQVPGIILGNGTANTLCNTQHVASRKGDVCGIDYHSNCWRLLYQKCTLPNVSDRTWFEKQQWYCSDD